MYCPNCGTENADNAERCTNCGYSLQAHHQQPQFGYAGQSYGQVPNYLVQAILTTIFCCLPIGIVAIVFAAQVNGKLAAGDYTGAQQASQMAKRWSWVSFGLGAGLGVFSLISAAFGLMGNA